MRLVQLRCEGWLQIAVVEEPLLRLIDGVGSIYAFAQAAIESEQTIPSLVSKHLSKKTLDYESIYNGKSEWKLLCPIEVPMDPSRLMVSGTGLTHLGSAKDRQSMHQVSDAQLTDSMRMFKSGVEGGKPAAGKIGSAPEWFFKGNGTILRAHNDALDIPSFALDGGEEAEIAGIYLIGLDGKPCRIGMAVGNEFSDHKFEKINYLNLAGSKLRQCSIGPELVIDPPFKSVMGKVQIERDGKIIWSRDIRSGEDEMSHSLANIEHHHFKFDAHRTPGDVHVHYFGAHSLSFGDGLVLQDGDVMAIQFEGFGRALRNTIRQSRTTDQLISVHTL